jgi:hypothetical protein
MKNLLNNSNAIEAFKTRNITVSTIFAGTIILCAGFLIGYFSAITIMIALR